MRRDEDAEIAVRKSLAIQETDHAYRVLGDVLSRYEEEKRRKHPRSNDVWNLGAEIINMRSIRPMKSSMFV